MKRTFGKNTDSMRTMLQTYLEVPQHDQTGGTDPGGGEARRVQDAVLVLLDHLSVAQQADQHHWKERKRA